MEREEEASGSGATSQLPAEEHQESESRVEPEVEKKPQVKSQKIEVRLQAAGDAPIMKQKKTIRLMETNKLAGSLLYQKVFEARFDGCSLPLCEPGLLSFSGSNRV